MIEIFGSQTAAEVQPIALAHGHLGRALQKHALGLIVALPSMILLPAFFAGQGRRV